MCFGKGVNHVGLENREWRKGMVPSVSGRQGAGGDADSAPISLSLQGADI